MSLVGEMNLKLHIFDRVPLQLTFCEFRFLTIQVLENENLPRFTPWYRSNLTSTSSSFFQNPCIQYWLTVFVWKVSIIQKNITKTGGSRISQTGASTYHLTKFFWNHCIKMKDIGPRRSGCRWWPPWTRQCTRLKIWTDSVKFIMKISNILCSSLMAVRLDISR